ncbi:MAG: peptide deformylase [Pseudomonadota bacterium]
MSLSPSSARAVQPQLQNSAKIKAADLEQLAKKGQVLKIARMGHPILAQKAVNVAPRSEEAKQIMADIAATVLDFGALQGVAVPQLHMSKRVVYYQVREAKVDSATSGELPGRFLINAKYENVGDETYEDWEACLSLPDLVGLVPRHKKIQLKAICSDGVNFEEVDEILEGHHARVLAHEIDHLDGILYPQRMQDFSKFGYQDEMLRYFVQQREKKAADKARATL